MEEKPNFVVDGSGNYIQERVAKIEATEILPPGVLDLDPILYKEDYKFLSKDDEGLFDEDQRKTKVLRRQQYGNRNKARARDVIIYKIDYLKKQATSILERWFAENRDPMVFIFFF